MKENKYLVNENNQTETKNNETGQIQDNHELTQKVVNKLDKDQVVELINTVDMDEN